MVVASIAGAAMIVAQHDPANEPNVSARKLISEIEASLCSRLVVVLVLDRLTILAGHRSTRDYPRSFQSEGQLLTGNWGITFALCSGKVNSIKAISKTLLKRSTDKLLYESKREEVLVMVAVLLQ